MDEVLASLLLTGGVVDESPSSGNLSVGLCDLVLHALEVTDQLTKLATIVPDVSFIVS